MSVAHDSNPKFAEYAHPERLVSTDWLAEHLHDPGLAVVESDEDVLLYETGHIPGAVKIDWQLDLNDKVTRDYVNGEQFAALMSAKGIARDTTVIIYGDKSNWWAAYALWVFTLFGLRGGHIPGAASVPWSRAAADDGTFKTRGELEAIYRDEVGLRPEDDVIAYCRIGERSSHSWFVLQHLLGFPTVRNYDGSWTEWGNTVRVPIVRGDRPDGEDAP